MESIENIRTVAALSQEPQFYLRYLSKLKDPYRTSLKRAHLVGLTYGFSQCIIYFAYATAFVFGAYLIEEKEMDYNEVFL